MVGVAIYVRTSTDDQHGEAQLRELRALVPGAVEYIDLAESGKIPARQRPQLGRLLAEMDAGRVKRIAVWALDRLGRNVADLLLTVDEMRRAGCVLHCKREGLLDPDTVTGRFTLHIFAALAEMERERITERVRSGVANARAKGKQLGRPRREVDADELRRLREDKGYSWRQVAMAMKVPVATLRRRARAPGQKPLPKKTAVAQRGRGGRVKR